MILILTRNRDIEDISNDFLFSIDYIIDYILKDIIFFKIKIDFYWFYYY